MLKGLMPRIMGFIVIIITLALGPAIYTANLGITGWTTTITGTPAGGTIAQFLGLSVVAGFGAFIVILGLLIAGGIFAVSGIQGKLANAGMGDILKVVGSVVVIIVMFTLFPSIMNYCDQLIVAAKKASDSLGEIGFGIIPIVIYVGVIAAAGWSEVSAYKHSRKGGSRRSVASGQRINN